MSGKLQALDGTVNFYSAAYRVFTRLIKGEGLGLLVLWGGSPQDKVKANKTYFLDMVDDFQKGASQAKPPSWTQIWQLLAQLAPGGYQCVSVIGDGRTSKPFIYQIPLAVAVPVAIATAVCRRGLTKGRNIVILCDDIQKFMEHNIRENEQFLRQLAEHLDSQTMVTFLGASQLTWDAKAVLGDKRVLPLGWD